MQNRLQPNRSSWARRIVVLGLLCWAAQTLAPAALLGGERADGRMRIHEWGTFTVLQDEHGAGLPGVNIDDEPVPRFVHDLHPMIRSPAVLTSEYWQYRSKGAPRSHPLVTMRLETPVIYFYPPEGASLPLELDVHVKFRGGWLTEYYPNAHVAAPGLGGGGFRFGHLDENTTGTLSWSDLKVGTDKPGPETDEHVWTAPREVSAVNVSTPQGESERYLFYRGVAHLHAPLSVATNRNNGQLSIRGNFQSVLNADERSSIRGVWLTDIRENGKTAYRRLEPLEVTASRRPILATTDSHFDQSDYAADNMQRLRSEMLETLIAEGLYADEAKAMLSTWQRAYFQSPGLRLFFTVPQRWTDHYLPLEVSVPSQISRVMMGRIELISNRQRELIQRLGRAQISDGKWYHSIPASHSKQRQRLLSGHADFGDLGVKIPEDFRTYLQLGRFRNGVVVSEERRRPTGSLTQFINTYGLTLYR